MDIQTSFASRLYDSARRIGEAPATAAGGAGASPDLAPDLTQTSFAETLARAAQDVTGTLHRGEQAAARAMAGQGDVQSVVEALTATELALQTAVSVRDRVVEAYQEVLRMPV